MESNLSSFLVGMVLSLSLIGVGLGVFWLSASEQKYKAQQKGAKLGQHPAYATQGSSKQKAA